MKLFLNREAWSSPVITRVAILIYFAMLIFIVGFGYYVIPYVIFLIAFLFIALNSSNLKLFEKIQSQPLVQKIFLIFFIALFLRFILLFQEQIITRDIEMYVFRSEWMIGGRIPYEDFAVNKPPLYAYMLQFLGMSFGSGELQFRAFFSIMDSVVAVLVFYLCLCKYDDDFSFRASFIYAICPLPIITIGLAGHYEPIVVICVLLSLIYLFKNKYNISALFLGFGFVHWLEAIL